MIALEHGVTSGVLDVQEQQRFARNPARGKRETGKRRRSANPLELY
ncbi:hypothetical protein [Bradyrhizobium sp. AC87j1]|nr:hypothetical protein [Bradyrhizobium sp. AC87j1]